MNESDFLFFEWKWIITGMTFLVVFLLIRFGFGLVVNWLNQLETYYQKHLVRKLLLQISPKQAVILTVVGNTFFAFMVAVVTSSWLFGLICFGVGFMLPQMVVKHLAQKRYERLEQQLVDGVVALASGVRAGLTLVQAMQLLVYNMTGPIQQEFAQLLKEYEMGIDLNQAMHNTSNRIGSSNYRLLFTAIEMHRIRGGDTGESLDRIAESIREIQRLEGKLDAITAAGRAQANMMAVAPVFIIGIYWLVDSDAVEGLFIESTGRILLIGAVILVIMAYLWIRRIMAVDI